MSATDLERLETNIERLREQIAGAQDALVLAAIVDKARIRQIIGTLRDELRDFEQQKWDLIAQITSTSDISNDEAEAIVAELVAEGEEIATNPPDDALVLDLLQKILGKLNEPDKNAAAKLKGAISVLPPFVSLTYEAELDTENTVRKYFPTFSTWTKNLASRLKK